ESFRQFQRRFDGIGEALLHAGLDGDAVDDNIDVVLDIALHRDVVVHVVEGTVYTNTDKALALYILDDFAVGALALADEWREQLDFGAFGKFEDSIDDALGGL